MRLLICTQAVDLDDPILGFFHRWIEEFAAHCESVVVICLKEGRHELPGNVRVCSLGKPRKSPTDSRGFGRAMWRIIYSWRFLRLICRLRKEYDAVFVHMNPEYVALGGPCWRLRGRKIGLWYVHKSVDMKLRIAVLFVNRVFSVSRESFRLPTRKLQIVPMGIDQEQFKNLPPVDRSMLRIITTGRVSPTKHVREMIAATLLLPAQGIPAHLSIVGAPVTPEDIRYEKKLRQWTLEQPRGETIEWKGPAVHADIPRLLSQSNVFLNLSATGSIDKAVLEALSADLPVVTSNVAFREMLAPYGLFVETTSPERVAQALERAFKTDVSALGESVRAGNSLEMLIPTIIKALQ